MGSLTGLFDLTRSALAATQAALTATANNVANQNTAGYTRQVVTFTGSDVVTLSRNGLTSQSTSQLEVSTSSVRDRVLQQRLQQQIQTQAASTSRSAVLTQIENVYAVSGTGVTPGSTQLGTALDSFFSSLTSLTQNPADGSTRQGVLSASIALAGQFNASAGQLQAVGQSIQAEVPASVDAVNSWTKTIAGLNREIAVSSPTEDAGALEDQRQLAIEQLSKLVGLDQIRTESNGITLTTQGGTVLVEGSTASTLLSNNAGRSVSIVDATGDDVTTGIQGGSLGGMLQAQQADLPYAKNALDALAFRVATAVNTQNAAGVAPGGSKGGAIFSVPATAQGAAAAITVIAGSADDLASAAVGEGATGNGNANALADIATATDAGGSTISGLLGTMLAKIGTTASGVQEDSTAQQAMLTQLTTQRDSLSAVSLDTEAGNLSEYQRSYQAAAKVLSVIDSLLTSAINLGTPTAIT